MCAILRCSFGFFAGKGIEALGVSCFGPVDLNEDSPTYGYITNTPKPGWQYVSVRGRLMEALGVPVGFDTDGNGAAGCGLPRRLL